MTVKKPDAINRLDLLSVALVGIAGWFAFNTAPKLVVMVEKSESISDAIGIPAVVSKLITPNLPQNRIEAINQQAFLDTIAYAEVGTVGMEGYSKIVFRGRVPNFRRHPQRKECGIINRKRICSTAAGRYQALNKTWFDVGQRIRLPDFSPKSQDAFALYLIKERGALRYVRAGNFRVAVRRIGGIWSSFPYNNHNQNPQRIEKLENHFNKRVRFYQYYYKNMIQGRQVKK